MIIWKSSPQPNRRVRPSILPLSEIAAIKRAERRLRAERGVENLKWIGALYPFVVILLCAADENLIPALCFAAAIFAWALYAYAWRWWVNRRKSGDFLGGGR